MSKRATAVFVIVMFLSLCGFDLYLAIDDIPGNTYSERIRTWASRWEWLPYAVAAGFGALLTHWFAKPYEMDGDRPGKRRPLMERLQIAGILLAVVAAGLVAGLLW
jgi:hypothetical protein